MVRFWRSECLNSANLVDSAAWLFKAPALTSSTGPAWSRVLLNLQETRSKLFYSFSQVWSFVGDSNDLNPIWPHRRASKDSSDFLFGTGLIWFWFFWYRCAFAPVKWMIVKSFLCLFLILLLLQFYRNLSSIARSLRCAPSNGCERGR